MFQEDTLFDWLTVYENLLLTLKITNTKENQNYVENLLKKYNLYEFKDKYPQELSGGMKQRISLIRTLSYKPDILLLDEPFSALDYQTRLSVCEDVYSIIKAEKKTSILVTHDISEAISMSDKIIILTARPAKVKTIFYPNLKYDSPLKRREDKEFGLLFEKIWEELH